MPLLIFLAKAFLVLIHFFVGYPNSSNICPGLSAAFTFENAFMMIPFSPMR